MGQSSRRSAAEEGAAPFGFLGERATGLTGMADDLLAQISVDDIREFLRLSPERLVRESLRAVDLRHAKKIPPAAAEAMLRVLRRGELRRRERLRALIADRGRYVCANADDLDAGGAAAILDAATAPDALDRAPALRGLLLAEWPVPIVRWTLARAVEKDLPLAPVALGLLLAEPAALGDHADTARAVWTVLRSEHPGLPECPVGLHELQQIARRRAAEEERSSMPSEDVNPLERLGAAVGALRERFAVAADAAERLTAGLRDGRRPPDDDLFALQELATRFDEVRAQVDALLPTEAPAADDLRGIEAAVDALRDTDRCAARIRSLRGLDGPDFTADLLAEVREAAGAGTADGLGPLAELMHLGGRPEDAMRAGELANVARAELPERWRSLVDLALMGHLTLTSADEDADEDEDAAGDGDDGSGSADGRGPEPAPDDDPDAGPGAGDRGIPAAEEADELADLDALLAEGEPRAASVPPPAEDRRPDPAESAVHGAARVHAVAVAERAADLPRPRPGGDAVAEGHASEGAAEERQPEVVPELTAELVQAEAAALRAGRFGVAGRLRTIAGRPVAEERARRCAALAGEMTAFAGVLSAEFTEAARGLGAKALADDPAGRLLAWAAAIRAGLVHPTPESTRLLEDLTIVVSAHAELAACGEAFSRAARSGAYLGPGLSGRIRGSAEAAMVRRNAVAEARRLREEAPHQKIRYQFATEVWKSLVQPDGPVGRLLVLAEQDEPGQADAVAADIAGLRSGDAINRMIDDCADRIAPRRKNKKIIAKAHAALVKKVENGLDTVASWAMAVKEADTGAVAETEDWRLGPLGQLQEAVGERREAIGAALAQLATAPDDPLLAAAADAAGHLLGQAFDLLAGGSLDPQEKPVAYVTNRHLLLAPGVALHPATLEPLAEPAAGDLVPVALAGAEDWTAAFEARADRLDHDGTRAIVSVLERWDTVAAARLRERRDDLVTAARAARDGRIERFRDRIAVWLRDGALTEEQARGAEETLRGLAGDRVDFDTVDRVLEDLKRGLDDDRRNAMDLEIARLAERGDGTADAARIRDRIDAGDLTTAREFMAQVEAGNPLPAAVEDAEHLDRFYPAFPQAFADIAVRAGSRARKQETSEALTQFMDALQRGNDVADADLSALLGGAGIKIPALRNARREESREGLRQWKACGLGSKTDATLRAGITSILKMIGLEGEQHDGPQEQHRRWIDLRNVRRVGETPLPAFGSRMSPSGDRLRLVLVWRRPGPQQLIELLKDQPEDQTILVFYFGVLAADERQQLAVAARRRPAPVTAVLDDAAIGYLACMPEADWSAAVALTAPFTATNPYAPVGDVPDEMFYGRDDQLRDITGRTRCSFVYGGRQLGKSALLRKAMRDIQRTDRNRQVILENIQTVGKAAPAESLWPKLADKLARAGVIPAGAVQPDQVRDAVRDWARRDPASQVLVLLDEADQFLNQDARDGQFQNVTALRDLMDDTSDRFKVVFAGLHQTARFQSLPNQPLAHLGTPVAVGPLEPQNAFDLLVRPLAALGFRFPETLAARAIAEANNAPALVQLFAEALLTRLRRNPATARLPYQITRDDVEAVWRDTSLARGFRDRFEWTLNLDKRYKVIAYTVALHALAAGADETLSVGDLWEDCRRTWAKGFEDCTGDGFRGLLDECVNLGVLGLSGDRYRLRTPHILNLLGGIDDVQKVLDNAGEFELPDSFDAHSYRGAYRNGPERAPLSSAQLARITRPHNLVHVVAGSRALQADRVHPTLKAEETERTDLKVHRVARGDLTFDGARARADRHDGHTVIVVDVSNGRTGQQFEHALQEALAAVAGHARGTLAVVLVAGPDLASAWVRAASLDGVELVELRRFDRPAVRQWMSEDSQQGFPDEAGQEALLARTGGWPNLIGQIVHRLVANGDGRDQALEHCLSHVRREPEEFVRCTGVLADPCLAAAWRALVREDMPGTPDDLAMLLEMYGEESPADLGPAVLAEHGYAHTADLVEALRVLGVFAPAENGLRCEPVLAEATRRAVGA